MTAPTGVCPGCNDCMPLRRTSGKVRTHDLVLSGGVARCSGSGEKPKAVTR